MPETPEQPTPATQAAEIARLRAAINVASRLIGETIERSREESSQAWFLSRLAKIKYALASAPTQHEPREDGGEKRIEHPYKRGFSVPGCQCLNCRYSRGEI